MIGDIENLLNLPFDTLFVLAVGYMGYRAAYIGRGAGKNAVETVFLSAVFAMLARAATLALATTDLDVWAVYPLAALVVLGVALLWRRWLQEWMFRALRRIGITDHDGFTSVWESMLARPLSPVSQLVVRLKSGKCLMCDQVGRFNASPLGPCLLGEDGSVALYVTHVMTDEDEGWVEMEPVDDEWGQAMTFIRADQISEVEIRRIA
ncbi:MAG: hypothetical protein JJU24_05280 [Natronohydrobacter sp.]|nr:hypothetical protein [Natronohydrobacter sp.]